jgi:hypothetical protein
MTAMIYEARGSGLAGVAISPLTRCVPHSEEETDMAQGAVKWFNCDKGFGFIAADGGGNAVMTFSGSAVAGTATMAVFVIGTSPLFPVLGYAARRDPRCRQL